MKKQLLLTLFGVLFILTAVTAQTIQTFNTSGSWVCPAGVTSVVAESWGGGGAGGGTTVANGGGGGGGGGAYKKTTLAVTPGNTYAYVVGLGGGGGTGAGANGGLSSFDGTNIANGGSGGGGGAAGTAGAGGTGGTFNGGNGAAGVSSTNSGGGGGGAGSTGNGGNASGATAGTAGGTDGGAGGAGRTSATTGNGNTGNNFGGGGSGARDNFLGGSKSGGDGGDGQVKITYTLPACAAPTSQPTGLSLSVISSSAINGSFTALSTLIASGYIVIRTTSATAPTGPVDGTTYTAGVYGAGGYIESVGTGTTWSSALLNAGTTYWYWIYAYNNVSCTGSIKYRTTSPLTGSATTTACGTVLNNTVTITTTGSPSSYNWSALSWSLGHVPTPCENAEIILNNTGSSTDAVSVVLDINVSVNSFKMTNISPSTTKGHIFQTNGGVTFNVANDMTITAPGGNKYNRCAFANTLLTIVSGNLILGRVTPSATEGHSAVGSTGNNPNQTYMLFGDMIYYPRGYTTDEWTKFIFDKGGNQSIVNNTTATDTIQPVLYENLVIGYNNATTVTFSGSRYDAYMELVGRAGVTIGTNSAMVLPSNYSMNVISGGTPGYFIMNPGSRLELGGNQSVAGSFGVAGSNFPSGYSPYTFDATSTVEYNGTSALTQTIYNGVTYANLEATNSAGTGRAQKITTGAITANTSFNIKALADVTLGSTVTSGGPLNVLTNGGLYCAANVVSGAGAFTLNNLGYLGMGHADGITSGTTTMGNIQMMGGRSYSTSGNYIYNGIVNQNTGNGLPTTCNDLTISNTAASGIVTMTPTTAQLVNGTHLISAGTFRVGTNNRVTIGAAATMNATGTGQMEVDKGILEFAGTSGVQNLDGAWFVRKTISSLVDNNSTGITVAATANDSLHISSALLYGPTTTNSTITTNDNISLLSRDTATARFGEIVTGSGNAIVGKVNVERYLPTLRKWRHLAVPIGSAQTVRDAWMEKNATANGNTKPGYGTIVTDDLSTAVAQNFDSRSVSGPSVKYYNPATNTYTSITNPSTFNINSQNSYYNFVRGDRGCLPSNATVSTTILRTTGTLKTGDQVFSVTAGKFASIGNPFASPIDIRKFDTVNLTSTFYVWDPKLTGSYGLGAYQTLYKSGAEYRIMPGGGSYGALNSFVDTIESGQAFFVRAGALSGTLTVKENAKTIGARAMSRGGNENGFTASGSQAVYSLLSLVDPGATTLVDGAMVAYDSAFNSAVDYDDALKMSNTSENVSIRREGVLLAIERRRTIRANDTLFLNLTGLRVHQYQWDLILDNMDAPGLTAFLIDKYLATIRPLILAGTNTVLFDVVNVPGAYDADRFMIVFKPSVVLPVHFTSISAVRNTDKTVAVSWNTADETAMQNYSIERSFDGRNFTSIGTQVPLNNNGGSVGYHLNDLTASDGDNYYRVRGNSITGRADYTSIVKVGPLKQNPGMSIYPNPVTDNNVNLKMANMPKGNYQIQVINNAGQVIVNSSIQLQNSNTVKTIQLPGSIAAGNYKLKVTDAEEKITTISFMVR
jgi:hypothetical protein